MTNQAYATITDAPFSKKTYDEFMARLDLYNKIAVGLRDVQEGRTSPLDEVMERILAGIPA